MSSTPNAELQMERGFLRAPWELMMRDFRALHKPAIKEAEIFSNSVNSLLVQARASGGKLPAGAIESLSSSLSLLQQRVKAACAADTASLQTIRARLEHLKAEKSEDTAQATSARWTRMQRLLVDYMLREGLYSTAEALSTSARLDTLVDARIFSEARTVIEALRRRDCSAGLRWCAENRRKLAKAESSLEFYLHLQEFVEFARKGERMAAIKYMRKNLAGCANLPEREKDIERVMALLAFDANTQCQPYKSLYAEEKWQELEDMFKKENYRLYGLTNESTIELMLKAGLASLKTRKCGSEHDKKPNCPTCNEPYLTLAKNMPVAMRVNSVLVCSISGSIMDENNPPMALPNGNVYGQKSLEELASKNDDNIIDPKTKESFKHSEVRKCYVV